MATKKSKTASIAILAESASASALRAAHKLAQSVANKTRKPVAIVRNPGKIKTARNIEAGFYNATGFHPIRSSRDYDQDRADDPEDYYPIKKKKRKTAKKRSR